MKYVDVRVGDIVEIPVLGFYVRAKVTGIVLFNNTIHVDWESLDGSTTGGAPAETCKVVSRSEDLFAEVELLREIARAVKVAMCAASPKEWEGSLDLRKALNQWESFNNSKRN